MNVLLRYKNPPPWFVFPRTETEMVRGNTNQGKKGIETIQLFYCCQIKNASLAY